MRLLNVILEANKRGISVEFAALPNRGITEVIVKREFNGVLLHQKQAISVEFLKEDNSESKAVYLLRRAIAELDRIAFAETNRPKNTLTKGQTEEKLDLLGYG